MSDNIKIAVQFFGHLRTYEQCAASIQQNLLNLFDCDVFMHTWSETESQTQTWRNEKCCVKPVDKKTKEKIKNLFHPKKILIETQNPDTSGKTLSCLHNQGQSLISVQGIKYMQLSQKKVNALRQKYQKENNIKYDYVVMLRPDIRLLSPFRLQDWNHEIISSVTCPTRFCAINGFSQSKSFAFGSDLASDILFFAKPETMDQIINLSDNINFDTDAKIWNPESFITDKLFKNGIATLNLHYYIDRNWEIVRCPLKTKKLRKRLIRIKLSFRQLKINLFPILAKNWFTLKFTLISFFTFELTIGKKTCLM